MQAMVSPIVDHPDEVTVRTNQGRNGEDVFMLSVHAEDTGQVIGKHGRNIKAVRTILQAAASGTGARPRLDIEE
ncbi:RNA-binding protein with KH domain [Salsuginibacillus halophilus]|uniref:RNA-binding protein with KH domain n=1 Tax=Salsuginibacillus halophilus TaxID=517424 RepID=A0A2P8HY45_9BACI|nr:RNA-binding protein with KH domain [Salsuginibacillus halophilus]